MFDLLSYKDLIETHPCHIATVRKDGSPNLAVAADILVIDSSRLLISCNEMVNTPINITPPLPHNIVLTSFDESWSGVRITGQATYYTTGKFYNLCNKHFKTETCVPKGTIVIEAEKIEEIS